MPDALEVLRVEVERPDTEDSASLSSSLSSIIRMTSDANITLRSLDGTEFRCSRTRLTEGSDLFKHMLESLAEEKYPVIDMAEPTETLRALSDIIHDPPKMLAPPAARPKFKPGAPDILPPEEPPSSLIAFNELRDLLYQLADKYQFTEMLIKPLHSHLLRHARTSPLEVYSLASLLELDDITSSASQFLLTPHVSTYSVEKARILTTSEAFYHLLQLQTYREVALRQILREEQVFPHDYLICRSHGVATRTVWEHRRQTVLDNLHAGMDVAEEMKPCLEAVANCPACKRGVDIAVEMIRVRRLSIRYQILLIRSGLKYKCYRVPRRICDLPKQTTS